jgi:hypothetical protein
VIDQQALVLRLVLASPEGNRLDERRVRMSPAFGQALGNSIEAQSRGNMRRDYLKMVTEQLLKRAPTPSSIFASASTARSRCAFDAVVHYCLAEPLA